MASANSFVEPKNTEQHPEVVEPDARIRVAAENLREDSLGIGHLAKLAVMACSISTTSFRDAPARRKATVRISPPGVLTGSLPPRVLALVIEWASRRRDALERDWDHARSGLPLEPIAPLD